MQQCAGRRTLQMAFQTKMPGVRHELAIIALWSSAMEWGQSPTRMSGRERHAVPLLMPCVCGGVIRLLAPTYCSGLSTSSGEHESHHGHKKTVLARACLR